MALSEQEVVSEGILRRINLRGIIGGGGGEFLQGKIFTRSERSICGRFSGSVAGLESGESLKSPKRPKPKVPKFFEKFFGDCIGRRTFFQNRVVITNGNKKLFIEFQKKYFQLQKPNAISVAL